MKKNKNAKIKPYGTGGDLSYQILGKSPAAILKEGKVQMKKAKKLTEKKLYIIYNLALIGLTDNQIASSLNISQNSWKKWKVKYALYAILEKARVEATGNVVSAVYKAAIGYSHEETNVLANRIKQFDAFGKLESEHTEPILVKTVKHHPPDMKAALKWLSVRYPEIWGDKQTVELKGEMTVRNLDLSDYTDDELHMMEKVGLKAIGRKEKNIEDAQIIQTSSN